jgi:NADH pyrophosphatase NudC (nudix superfamily)
LTTCRSGVTKSRRATQKWRAKHEYDAIDKEALKFSCKTHDVDQFVEWLKFQAMAWDKRWQEKSHYFLPQQRKTRFQSKQRALTQATRRLTAGRKDCVIVWGAGSVNAPIIKGTPKAPNKMLYRHLARVGYTVIISSEMRTSQECDTCKAQVYHPRRRKLPFCGYCGCDDASCKVCMATPCHTCKKRKRRFSRISCCRQCKTMRDRDLAAAANIKDLFWDIVLVASK